MIRLRASVWLQWLSLTNSMSIDLHLHTNHSDGNWSPEAMIEYAVKLKLKHISVTDHDTTSGIVPAIKAAGSRLEVIAGVEINTVAPDTFGKLQDIHILGYFIDAENISLQNSLAKQRSLRDEHVQAVILRLKDAGVQLTLNDIKKYSGEGTIGKAQITKAIVSAGGARDIMEAYEKYTSKKSEFFVQRRSITPVEAVESICNAGGIACLAHPGKRTDVFDLIQSLKQHGLRAVEVYHRMHSQQQRKRLIDYAQKHNLLVTGGSDCHGPYEDCLPSIGTMKVPEIVLTKLRAAALT